MVDGWVAGKIDVWTDDGWVNEWTVNRQVDAWISRDVSRWVDGRTWVLILILPLTYAILDQSFSCLFICRMRGLDLIVSKISPRFDIGQLLMIKSF